VNVINIHELQPNMNLRSAGDTAQYFNLFHHETVEEILESFTDFTDFDIIAELVDILGLDVTAVVEPIRNGMLIYGYVFKGGAVA